MSTWRRAALVPGIYDEVITARVQRLLVALPATLQPDTQDIKESGGIAPPLAALVREAIDAALGELDGQRDQTLAFARELFALLGKHAPRTIRDAAEYELLPKRLLAIIEEPATECARPKGSLHRSSLIVNAEGDQLLDHLRSEFDSADRVDLLCAFVKLSGVEKLRAELNRHTSERGRELRVLTTTYMRASDQKAIVRLAGLPNVKVKISYDADVTRLHAKAWLFHRGSGVSTAYVGSSNLSHAAQTEGLEWNVRITQSEQPALIEQVRETFEQYWEDANQFELFDPKMPAQRERLERALAPARDVGPEVLLELEPKSYQRPVLEELREARRLGRHRNLIVAATGTGKTVMAALDYRDLRAENRVDTLLFVAHRREILEQARTHFRAALQNRDFGEMLHQYEKPKIGRHVFASIDSLREGAELDPTTFDMVIVDEAHHAGATTWNALLGKINPRELVGLTGTPERADGIDYAHHFPRPWIGNLRVWNAIPHALVPFRYYMLSVEGVDLEDVAWSRGAYVREQLEDKLVDAADIFVRRAIQALAEHVARPDDLRAIAFCVDRRHAEAVAERFQRHRYKTQTLTQSTPPEARREARFDLDGGRIQILCVVDLYNEGVDVPNVNTLFFFRPTESATVFLQQLGRGLRRTPSKPELVVFDLTGRHRLEFRFDLRLRALLGHTPRQLRDLVESGSGRLPSGCLIQFDELARADVLSQLKRAVPTDVSGIRKLIADPAHHHLDLAQFLRETEVELEDLYSKGTKGRSWTWFRREAGLDQRPLAAGEAEALENVHKLLHVGDDLRLSCWLRFTALQAPSPALEKRVLEMLFVVLYGKELAPKPEAWAAWESHPILREEIAALAPILATRNALLAEPHELAPEIPLRLHASYLSSEISAAFAAHTVKGHLRDYYSGVEATKDGRYDLLLTTLQKAPSKKEHLKYRDFPLNEWRFHWQSKADTTRDSGRGRRHLTPEAEGCTPLLFVRHADEDARGVTAAFQYLGPVSPAGHSGERPITVEWRLRFALPPALVARGRVAA